MTSVYEDIRYSAPSLSIIQFGLLARPEAARLRDVLGNDLGSAGGGETSNLWMISQQPGGDSTELFGYVLQEASRLYPQLGPALVILVTDLLIKKQIHVHDFDGEIDLGQHTVFADGSFEFLSDIPAPGADRSEAEIFRKTRCPSLLFFYSKTRQTNLFLKNGMLVTRNRPPQWPVDDATAYRKLLRSLVLFSQIAIEGNLEAVRGAAPVEPTNFNVNVTNVKFFGHNYPNTSAGEQAATGAVMSVGNMATAWRAATAADLSYFSGPDGVAMQLDRCVPSTGSLLVTDCEMLGCLNLFFTKEFRSRPQNVNEESEVDWQHAQRSLPSTFGISNLKCVHIGLKDFDFGMPYDGNHSIRLEDTDADLDFRSIDGFFGPAFLYQDGKNLPPANSDLVIVDVVWRPYPGLVNQHLPYIHLSGNPTEHNPSMRRKNGIIANNEVHHNDIQGVELFGQQNITIRNLSTQTEPIRWVTADRCHSIRLYGVAPASVVQSMFAARQYHLIVSGNCNACEAVSTHPSGMSVLDLGANTRSANVLVSNDPVDVLYTTRPDLFNRGNFR